MRISRRASSSSNMKNAYLPRALLVGGHKYENILNSELDFELERSPERRSVLLEEILSSFEKRKLSLRQTRWRWFALALVCMTNFALYYCSNNTTALQPIIEAELKIGDSQFNLLYSVYSFPNIIFPFFGGLIVDRIGVRLAINIFGFILLVGQCIFTYGSYLQSFPLMIVGRFIFGIGGENIAVAQLPMVSKWFATTELSLAWGFGRAAIRVGSSLSSLFSPRIYMWTQKVYVPFIVGIVVALLSWLSGLLLACMDRRADKQEGERESETQRKGRLHFHDLKALPFIFYLLLITYPCLYGSFLALSNNIPNIMVERFGFNVTQTGNLVMIIYLVAGIIGPFFAPFLDKYGKRIRVMFCAGAIFLLTQIQIIMLKDRPKVDPNYGIIVSLCGISLFYSVFSMVVWPCLPLIVEKKVLGTATGILTSGFNLMLTILPFILGVVHDHTLNNQHGYFWTEIIICGVASVGILSTIGIYFEDLKRGAVLDRSPHDLIIKEEDAAKEDDGGSENSPLLIFKDDNLPVRSKSCER